MGVHFHFFKHFILKFAEAQFTRYTFSWKMVDTVNVTRQMERNANLGISDFYLVEDQEGKVNYTGTMDLAATWVVACQAEREASWER